MLDLFTVDRATQFEIVGVVELVGSHQPGADHREAGIGLGEAELRGRALHLADPLGDVLADGQAGDVAPGVGLGHPVRLGADDHDQLDLPVGVAALRQSHLGDGAGDARDVFGEDRWVLGDGEAGLQRVRPVVQPDGEQLPGGRGGRAEVGRVEAVCAGELGSIDPGAELGPLRVDRLRVGREAAVAGLLDIYGAAVGHDDEAGRRDSRCAWCALDSG